MAEIRFVAEVTPELEEALVNRVQAAVDGLVEEVVCCHPDPRSPSSIDAVRCELEAGHDGVLCQSGGRTWKNRTHGEAPRNRRMEVGVTVVRRSDEKPFVVKAIVTREGERPDVKMLGDSGEVVKEEYSGEFWGLYHAQARIPARPTIRVE